MRKIFSIAPPRLGGIDLLLPIFIEMKLRSNVFIEIIFENESVFNQLKRDSFLYQKLSDTVDKVSFIRREKIGSKSSLIKKIYNIPTFAFELISIIHRISMSEEPILMHSKCLEDRLIAILGKITKIKRGMIVGHYKLMTLFANSGVGIKRDMDGKVISSDLISNERDRGDIFLCFNNTYAESQNVSSKTDYINIGYPRLYDSWIDSIAQDSKFSITDEEFEFTDLNNNKLSVLFLPSTVKNIFEKHELKKWIYEVIECLLKVFPSRLIILKPHPMQNIKYIESIISAINYDSCQISFLHPALLASKAEIVISHHSSTILDALAFQVPVIQHQTFTKHWIESHPEGSEFLRLGHAWTQNSKSLIKELIKIKNNQWSHPDFMKSISHENNINDFFNRVNL